MMIRLVAHGIRNPTSLDGVSTMGIEQDNIDCSFGFGFGLCLAGETQIVVPQ